MAILLSINTTDPDLVKSQMFGMGMTEVMQDVIANGKSRSAADGDKVFRKAYDASAQSTERHSLDFKDGSVRMVLRSENQLSDEEEAKIKLHLTVMGNKTDKSFRFVATDMNGKVHYETSCMHDDFKKYADFKPHHLMEALRIDQPPMLEMLTHKGMYIDAAAPVMEDINSWIFNTMVVSVFTGGMHDLEKAFPQPKHEPKVH